MEAALEQQTILVINVHLQYHSSQQKLTYLMYGLVGTSILGGRLAYTASGNKYLGVGLGVLSLPLSALLLPITTPSSLLLYQWVKSQQMNYLLDWVKDEGLEQQLHEANFLQSSTVHFPTLSLGSPLLGPAKDPSEESQIEVLTLYSQRLSPIALDCLARLTDRILARPLYSKFRCTNFASDYQRTAALLKISWIVNHIAEPQLTPILRWMVDQIFQHHHPPS